MTRRFWAFIVFFISFSTTLAITWWFSPVCEKTQLFLFSIFLDIRGFFKAASGKQRSRKCRKVANVGPRSCAVPQLCVSNFLFFVSLVFSTIRPLLIICFHAVLAKFFCTSCPWILFWKYFLYLSIFWRNIRLHFTRTFPILSLQR